MQRRHFLHASGITLALPWFESLAASTSTTPPKRFCTIYFPYGVSLPTKEQEAEKAWNWFPNGSGKDFTFNKSLEVLEPLRDQITVLGGLSHPKVRRIGGHDSGDTFLTAEELHIATGLKNSVSFDQYLARTKGLGESTRFTSLVLSNDGGVGMPTRATTLSFSESGQPIPAINRPALVFERLFGLNSDSIDAQRKGLTKTGSHLDLLMGEAKTLRNQLGAADQQKLDQYLTSVREVEQNVERSARWLDVPRPQVNATGLSLDADTSTPDELIRTMLDLIVLAFQTDSTRFATYQLASMHGAISIANKFPGLLGHPKDFHGLAHGMKKAGGAEALGKWDRYLASQLHYFLTKLNSIEEGAGTLLDSTTVLYGSSNSYTHTNTNYPLILAGGKATGHQHGQYLTYDKDVPLTNLFVTIQNRMGVEATSFADSTGPLVGV